MDCTHRAVSRRTVLGAGLLSVAAACSRPAAGVQPARPERDHLKISIYALPDIAPLYVAIRGGMFQRAGLTVELLDSETSEAEPDIYFGSWVGQFSNLSKGADYVFVGEASQATERYTGLVVSPDSSYRLLSDIPQPRIGIAELNGVGRLLTESAYALSGSQVEFVQLKGPEIAGALGGNRVDACWVIEPQITTLQVTHGTRLLVDTASGPTKGFPLSGYSCPRKFAEDNPRTVRAFQAVLKEAQEVAADPARLRDVLVEDIKIDPSVASLMPRPQYPVSLNAARLQRVADHMFSHGRLPAPLDVRKVLYVRG